MGQRPLGDEGWGSGPSEMPDGAAAPLAAAPGGGWSSAGRAQPGEPHRQPRQPGACARSGRPPWRWGGSEDHIAASGSELPVAGCQAVIIVSVTIAEAVAN
ncbi:unnamed protein product [Coccothraustes coccothraustes]